MDEQKRDLKTLIDFVNDIANQKGNEWFKNALVKSLIDNKENKDSFDTNIGSEIKKDTKKIINFLEINPSCSIDYSFIDHKLLRTRLELDNLRMENVRYDLKEKDEMKRLYDFCINAFYQIENLINFYYFEKYTNFENFLSHLESIEGTSFRRKEEKNIGDITIATKIFAFTRSYYINSERFLGMNMDSLRLIRNEGLHRCSRIKNVENENKRLHQFIKFATFDSIHAIVDSLSKKIQTLLNK
jgi:hypothetical protein